MAVADLPDEMVVALFAGAEAVVALGRGGLAASCFCAPGTPVVAVTAPGEEGVEAYLASLDLHYSNLTGERAADGWLANPGRLAAAVTAYIS